MYPEMEIVDCRANMSASLFKFSGVFTSLAQPLHFVVAEGESKSKILHIVVTPTK
jgi:hypothetical protein